ncbi:phosphoribosylglycinamide formyltransferase [Fodinicurvata halophila]|uniref:Phosphoribosylglycinamide formyltransferase n=1 Tax=Fodinicurvata halophila TaxID=1419723 RepID=A0ABV8UK47_9PROT
MAESEHRPLRVAVMVSGRGSNLQALLDAAAVPSYPVSIELVVSNVPDVQALERAGTAGIRTATVPHRDFDSREAFERKISAVLESAAPDLICQAGFMRILTPWFIERWHNRLINIHPSLLPAFPGLRTHEKALEAGVRLHGCTVHLVRTEVDSGPIIGQAAVPVSPEDTSESLAARVLRAEHKLYPTCLQLIAESHIRLGEDKVHFTGSFNEDDALLLNPGTAELVRPSDFS